MSTKRPKRRDPLDLTLLWSQRAIVIFIVLYMTALFIQEYK